MALQAKDVHIADIQQPRIGRPMGRVACNAPLGFDHGMLKDKWAGGLAMALGADLILIGSCLQLLAFKGAVGIMAVAARHQPFIHFVVEGLSERRFHFGMAGVAQLRLGDFE